LKPDFNTEGVPARAGDRPRPVSLAELAPGEAARIVGVEGDTRIGRRLGDLGFLPGTSVRALSRAPLGDPTVYELRGSRFCLRRGEARCVFVERGAEPDRG
jgi:ferrous iron transport protein A